MEDKNLISTTEVEGLDYAAIDAIRLEAFLTNDPATKQRFLEAAGRWFQYETIRALDRYYALTAQQAENERWRTNSLETWHAMQTMRNAINEHVPMPSVESDLLQGPENSIFCATVAEAVIDHIARLTAERDAARASAAAAYKRAANLDGIEGYSNAVPRHRIRALATEAETSALAEHDKRVREDFANELRTLAKDKGVVSDILARIDQRKECV